MLIGKTAAITGGSGGIGSGIALELASRGADIALLYSSNEEDAWKISRRCQDAYGVTAVPFLCDVTDFDMTKRVSDGIIKTFGSVEILVNNAGITRDKLMIAMRKEDFDDVIDVNLRGAFHMTRHILPFMVRKKEGCIINVSSVSGLTGNLGQVNYAASKAGLIGFTKSVAREYASRGIRCNALAPGFIETQMTKELNHDMVRVQIPLKRFGTPEDVAKAAAFLAEADYVTGEVLRVDGGIAM